jgi:hypothetical protein
MILQRIKTANGYPVAFVMDKGNGVQCIQSVNGVILGWYRPSPTGGRTTTPNGNVIGMGNVLTSLVTDLL